MCGFHFEETVLLPKSDFSCRLFCQDGNGYIDEQELDALLKDLCDKNRMVMNSLPIDLSVQVSFLLAKYRAELD